MDIQNRKTALDDSSILYQKRDESQNKQNVKELDWKGKFQYFRDYYLLKVLIILAILIVGGNMCYTMLFRHSETVLSMSAIGTVHVVESEQMETDLLPLFAPLKKGDTVSVGNYNLAEPNMQMAFTTHMAANFIDLILCDREQFERYAANGSFLDLSSVLDEETYHLLSDSILEGCEATYDNNGDIESYLEPYPMVIDLSGNEILSSYQTTGDEWYLGICTNTEHLENALLTIRYLTGQISLPEAAPEQSQ